MKRLRGGLTVVALLLAAGCGAGGSSAGGAETFDVSGTVKLSAANGVLPSGYTCIGTGAYDDIRRGASVVVFDALGNKVGMGELGTGRSGTSQFDECNFNFKITGVPAGDNIYAVEVSKRGQVSFEQADAEGLDLTLGV